MTIHADGVLVIDKPEGPTSHDIVAVARRALGTRQVGHTGTLDPMATGVLALLVGRATRLARFLAGDSKAYDADVRLGVETDSWDRTGIVVRRAKEACWPSREAVGQALERLTGAREQLPPPFSAKKLGGVRAYALARRGEEVTLQPVPVVLHQAEVVDYSPPSLRLRMRSSAGFYVRALAHELGEALGCGACLEGLRRTASGSFTLESAVSLEALELEPAAARAAIVPLEALLLQFPAATLHEEGVRKALHGNDVGPVDFVGTAVLAAAPDVVRLLDPAGALLGLARPAGRPGFLHPAVVLK